MARPVNANAAATRARIRASAVELFAARGLGQTSIRQIAKQADVSLAMVHHYFGSKDDLYRACVDAMYEALEALRGELLAAIAEGGSVAELLDRALRACWIFARNHRPALRLVMRQVIDTGEVPAERRDSFLVPFLDQAGALFGSTGDTDPARVRMALQSIVFLIVRYALSTETELAEIVGQDEPDDTTLGIVEDQLVDLAMSLLPIAAKH